MCQSLPGALKEEMLPFCFAASWLLRTPIICCAPCRRDACSRAARRRGHGSSPRWVAAAATPSSNTSTLRFTAPMRFTWFYNSDASELATRVSDQRMSERTGICRALASHASSRSLNCASRTRTLVYNMLDTHAACLRSPASLARDTHIAHVQRSLDLACLLPACTQSRD